MNIKNIVLIPLLAAIIFVQQLALSFIPNVQLTTLLIVLYTKVLGLRKSILIMILHITAYNILAPMGPVLITHLPFMIIAWFLLIVVVKFTKNNIYLLSIIGLIYGFVFGLIMAIPAVIFLEVPLIPYLISDLPFEILMALSNFITILWLYDRLYVLLNNTIAHYNKTD